MPDTMDAKDTASEQPPELKEPVALLEAPRTEATSEEKEVSPPEAATSEEKKVPPPEAEPSEEREVPPPEAAFSEEKTAPPAVSPAPTEEKSSPDVTRLTAEMWQYHDVPANEPDPFPEYLQREITCGKMTLLGARVRGKKHKHDGTNCDDWFEMVASGEIACIAVADGAGSRRLSRLGARAACQAAVGYMRQTFARVAEKTLLEKLCQDEAACREAYQALTGVVQEAFVRAYAAVESEYYRKSADPVYGEVTLRDFASTLLAAAVIPVPGGEKLVISCQIGDGIIALLNTGERYDKAVKMMGEADSGEYSGETDFLVNRQLLTPESLARRTRLSRGHADVLLMMTDGVGDDYFPGTAQLPRLYLDLVANGVLEGAHTMSTAELSSGQLERIQRLPAPERYPWINDRGVVIPLNDTRRIAKALGVSLEDLWEDKPLLSIAAVRVKEGMPGLSLSERLKRWLDSYTVRGSFDDRTLVIARI